MNLKKKLICSIVVAGLVPAFVISAISLRTASHLAEDIGKSYENVAESVADKVDRSLFERYGDVQSFASNAVIFDQASWRKVGSAENKIAAAINDYIAMYGVYSLSFAVDLEGNVIAVNDKDAKGKSIDSGFLYKKSFKNADWFREVLAGHFLKGEGLDGTYVQDIQIDEDVKKACASDGVAIGFSAPIKGKDGNVIGVWHNAALGFQIEHILHHEYDSFKKEGHPNVELAILDSKGRLIFEYDPQGGGQHDFATINKINLVERGSEVAKELVARKSGFKTVIHTRKNVEQLAGYAPCDGALGFPGLNWGVLVRLEKSDALKAESDQIKQILLVSLLSVAGLIVAGWYLATAISKQLLEGVETLEEITGAIGAASGTITTSSQTVATGASEQAASLEETSASLEEIAAMARRTAENAASGKNLSTQAKTSANSGLGRLDEMSRTLGSIRSAVKDMEAAVSEMQESSRDVGKIIKTIDEIAFQTNLLALNAAVEAARAGEAGMGFAVVADEVRALAQRSAVAAKETSEKIESAIKRSELGSVASAKVVHSLGEVDETAHNLEDVFRGIVSQISQLDDVIGEMTSASQEQSTGVSEVNMAVAQMDKVIQMNAGSAEANAASAEDLNGQVQSLQDVVWDLQVVVSGRGGSQRGDFEEEDSEEEEPAPAPVKSRPRAVLKKVAEKVLPKRSRKEMALPKRSAGSHPKETVKKTSIPMPEDNHGSSFKDF